MYQVSVGRLNFWTILKNSPHFQSLIFFPSSANLIISIEEIINIKKVAELKKVRDASVHPKKIKIPVELSLDHEKHEDLVELGLGYDASPMPQTKIDKSSMFWFSGDAKAALEAVLEFYDYYFIDILKLKHEKILGLLGNSLFLKENCCVLFHQQFLKKELEYVASIGINQNFINLECMRQISVPWPLTTSSS